MRKLAVLACLLLGGCASSNIAANLKAIDDAIVAGERNLALLCVNMPIATVTTTTAACIARANGTTMDIIARSIAAAQAICAGTLRPPSTASALTQIEQAALAAANAQAAGCQ